MDRLKSDLVGVMRVCVCVCVCERERERERACVLNARFEEKTKKIWPH